MNDATNPDGGTTLCHEMTCVLIASHRDRLGDGVFRPDVQQAALADLAALLARRLAPLIGGRYVPKIDERALRNAEIIKMWELGVSRNEIIKHFNISRRLSYNITTAEQKRRRRGVL